MPLFRDKYEVSDELLNDFKSKFIEEVDSAPEEEAKYHPDDVQLAKENDWYIARYLLHQDSDVDKALEMIRLSLRYRQEMDINTLLKEDLPESYFDTRMVQIYNVDKNNFPVLAIRTKIHRKNPQETRLLHQYCLYWVEKAVRQNDWGPIAVLFDTTDTSYKNVDFDLIKFLLSTFQLHYPWTMHIFMVYNLPWYLAAVWKIIKTWIPEKHANRIVFVDQNSILEYMNEDQLPVCMGGTCTDQYDSAVVEEKSKG